ncbi:hypothetical protein [Bergeriella denitrificans]|uniref:hypothetical protein n=1 Tax=Bergeriella denitrificans TaxID=494 RepID=UPI0011C04709|nr:hypothetical protein [Bergeriella denitrificans]
MQSFRLSETGRSRKARSVDDIAALAMSDKRNKCGEKPAKGRLKNGLFIGVADFLMKWMMRFNFKRSFR